MIVAAITLFAPLVVLLFLSRKNSRPIQFRLRTLFVTMTVVALILGGIGWWRTANIAHIYWLDPTSPAIDRMFPPAIVRQNEDGEWATVYRARYRDINDLTGRLEADGVTPGGDHTIQWDSHQGTIGVAAENRELLNAYVWALRAADKLGPREMVLRGRVEDSEGLPVAGAFVDLMGPYVYINHFQTREDGTFVMPMKPHEAWGYYLRIRPKGGEPMATGRFSLSYDEPEQVVVVKLP